MQLFISSSDHRHAQLQVFASASSQTHCKMRHSTHVNQANRGLYCTPPVQSIQSYPVLSCPLRSQVSNLCADLSRVAKGARKMNGPRGGGISASQSLGKEKTQWWDHLGAEKNDGQRRRMQDLFFFFPLQDSNGGTSLCGMGYTGKMRHRFCRKKRDIVVLWVYRRVGLTD